MTITIGTLAKLYGLLESRTETRIRFVKQDGKCTTEFAGEFRSVYNLYKNWPLRNWKYAVDEYGNSWIELEAKG